MTASLEGGAANAGQTRVPDFFIVGPPEVRDDRAVPDAAAPPADLHAGAEGAVVPRAGAALALHGPQTGDAPGHAGGVPARCSPPAAPEQRAGEASSSYLMSRTAAAEHRRAARPTRGSSRSCASRRASCARFTCRACACTSRPRPTCAPRSRWRTSGARAGSIPPRCPRPQVAAVLRARSLRRAVAPLPRASSPASRCWC